MSNETKRDVFERALTEWCKLIFEIGGQGEEAYGYCDFDVTISKYEKDYDVALSDDLPVIPEAVSEYIKWGKEHGESLYSMIADYPAHLSYEVEQFVMDWMPGHSGTFARAWLDGYEVEHYE